MKNLLIALSLVCLAVPSFADHHEGKKGEGKACTECKMCKHKKGEKCDCDHDKKCEGTDHEGHEDHAEHRGHEKAAPKK